MSRFSSRGLVLLLVLVTIFSSIDDSSARNQHWRRKHAGKKPKPSPPHPKPSPSPSPSPSKSTFNVLDFGAKGNGNSDETEAFLAAWAAACKVKASKILVPAKYTFLVGPVSFSGSSCQPNMVFQLDGMIIAPTSPKAWGSGLGQWLGFAMLNGFTMKGSGTVDGRGNPWWTNSLINTDNQTSIELKGKMPHTKPTAVRFYKSYGVTVSGISIKNSPQFHLKFDNCDAVQVYGITVSSPSDSPNTDGIHLQNTVNVVIHHVNLACGDDCISIQTGCSNVFIHDVNCGPGHGISIGGLGAEDTKACVSDVTIQDINIKGTTNGIRIKTVQGGSGSVRNIKYSNIYLYDVQMPIVIDQYYCNKGNCKNQTSAVAVSGITYSNIVGTYTVLPVKLACSDSRPCSNIALTDVKLQPHQEHYNIRGPFCWKAYGNTHAPIVPPIDCLNSGKLTSNSTFSVQDSC